MIEGLTYVILTSDDLPRSQRFFTEQLGLETEDEMPGFAQFTTRAGTMWGISAGMPIDETPGYKVFLRVTDVDAAYRTWRERGVEMVSEPRDEPFGRTFALRDPDGRVLYAWAPLA